jgi:hypothetical protein
MKYPSEGSDIPFSTWREAQLMIAEVTAATDPDGAIPILNTLRTSTEGLYAEIDDSAWPLPTLDPTPGAYTAAEVDYLVKEERRRELWMQGAHHGDKLRWAGNNYPDWEPTDEYGQLQGAGTCWPVPFLEVASNPNLS